MSTHLADALDRAIPGSGSGSAPPLPSADERLARGRHGVRRRRLAAGSVVAAVAAAAVAVPSVLVEGSTPQRAPVASTGTTSAPLRTTATPPDAGYDPFEAVDGKPTALVRIGLNDGPVAFLPGVTVLDALADPFSRSGLRAYAATVDFRGKTYWALSHETLDGGTYSLYERPVRGLSIARWVRDYEVLNTAPGHRWLELADDGTVTGRDGAVVLSQRSPASVEEADPDRPSAIAELEVDGGRICVIARRTGTRWSEELALPESRHRGCADLPGWDYPGNPAS